MWSEYLCYVVNQGHLVKVKVKVKGIKLCLCVLYELLKAFAYKLHFFGIKVHFQNI